MTNADELERLTALKEKGALTQEEFESAKADLLRPKKKSSLIRTLATWGLGLFLLWAAVSTWLKEGASRPTVPLCESTEAKATLQKSFDQSQVARTQNLSAVEVIGSRETKYDKTKGIRICTASLSVNNTAIPNLSVVFELEKREGGQFMLTFQVLDQVPAPDKSALSQKQAAIFTYGKPVSISGTLTVGNGEGPNNEKVSFPAIRLDAPITVNGVPGGDITDGDTETGVKFIQLVLSSELHKKFQSLSGQQATLTCLFFHRHTGHHLTDVLCEVQSMTQ